MGYRSPSIGGADCDDNDNGGVSVVTKRGALREAAAGLKQTSPARPSVLGTSSRSHNAPRCTYTPVYSVCVCVCTHVYTYIDRQGRTHIHVPNPCTYINEGGALSLCIPCMQLAHALSVIFPESVRATARTTARRLEIFAR